MSRLTRDGTAEPVSRDQILRYARGQGNIHFPCSADHEQDWQPYPVDPYSAICDDHTMGAWVKNKLSGRDLSLDCTITLIARQGHQTQPKQKHDKHQIRMSVDEGDLQV